MTEATNIVRPVRWSALRTDEAQRIVRERVKESNNIVMVGHPLVQVNERSALTTIVFADVINILETGYVEPNPRKNQKGDWEVIVTKPLRGNRETGVVTIIITDSEQLIVKTVMWMDL